MLHTSKGRKLAIPAPVSDGAHLSQIFNYNANPITFRTIGGALMVKRERLEAILSGIKSQIDTAQVARLPISTPTLF